MKTTVQLSDELLAQVRALARREGLTLRQLMEEGLQRALEAAGWARIREEIYSTRQEFFAPGKPAVHDRD